MPLIDVKLAIDEAPIPADVCAFLAEAERRIDEYQRASRAPGFVASDHARVYRALHALAADHVAPGKLFCEWGSGFGVVAGLAAMLGFDAVGIEINAELVGHARSLAGDFSLRVEFIHGSFIPVGGAIVAELTGELAWIDVLEADTDVDPAHFDVVFAYPWPGEERATERLFERFASRGALLLTHHGDRGERLRRKR
jgi:hypothetical protein